MTNTLLSLSLNSEMRLPWGSIKVLAVSGVVIREAGIRLD